MQRKAALLHVHPMGIPRGHPGSILHNVCRILALIALVVSTNVIIRFFITVPVLTNVSKSIGIVGRELPTNNSGNNTSIIGSVKESKAIFNGTFLQVVAKVDLAAIRKATRFVLFLCDPSYFNGSVALVASLAESSAFTSIPPLVMVVGNDTIQPLEKEILEALGAQVKIVDLPQSLQDAIALRQSSVQLRFRDVFSKILLFRPDIVECDIVFYMDIDTLARGDLIDCMYDIIQRFRSKPQLDFLAVGSRYYFNNGVMLARPNDTTFSYLVEMLRNGTCMVNCTESEYTTMMRREAYTDQDVFFEYTQRFPERFEPEDQKSRLNQRPKYQHNDTYHDCSVVHYIGTPKPWESWFAIPSIGIPLNGSSLLMLPDSYIPESLHTLFLPDWALELWRDSWNQAVIQSVAHPTLA